MRGKKNVLDYPYARLVYLPPDASYVYNVYRLAHLEGVAPPMPSDVAERAGWGRKRMMVAVKALRDAELMDGYTPT